MPWAQREQLGVVRAFVEQTKVGLRNPRLYVSGIRPEGRWQDAFSYGWLMSAFVGLLSIPYNAFNFWRQAATMKQTLSALGNSAAAQMVGDLYEWLGRNPLLSAASLAAFSVVLFPLLFLVNSGTQQLGLIVSGVGGRKPITATMLAVGYPHAVSVLMAIPVVGGFAGLYLLVVQIWALREVHKASVPQAAFAVLWPSLLMCCCGGVAGIAFAVKLISGIR